MRSGTEDRPGEDSVVEDRVVVEPVTVPETKLDLLDSERMFEAAMTMPVSSRQLWHRLSHFLARLGGRAPVASRSDRLGHRTRRGQRCPRPLQQHFLRNADQRRRQREVFQAAVAVRGK